jgi:hypothetical protein
MLPGWGRVDTDPVTSSAFCLIERIISPFDNAFKGIVTDLSGNTDAYRHVGRLVGAGEQMSAYFFAASFSEDSSLFKRCFR